MESASLAGQSVSADVSEFFRAELEAFVALSKRQRPAAWSHVEQLQRACRCESPNSALAGSQDGRSAGAATTFVPSGLAAALRASSREVRRTSPS